MNIGSQGLVDHHIDSGTYKIHWFTDLNPLVGKSQAANGCWQVVAGLIKLLMGLSVPVLVGHYRYIETLMFISYATIQPLR